MVYGYNESLRQFIETSADKEAMSEVKTQKDPVTAFVASTAFQVMARQLYNTYTCLLPYFLVGKPAPIPTRGGLVQMDLMILLQGG